MSDNHTTAGNPNDTSKSLSLEEQDALLFGNRNKEFADALAQQAEQAIQRGVASLPLLQADTKKQGLCETILSQFLRNIDVVEVYAGKNIFSIGSLAPRQRERLVAAFQDDDYLPQLWKDLKEQQQQQQDDDSSKAFSSNYPIPTKEQIPDEASLQELQAKVADLQKQLQDARVQRNALQVDQAGWQGAHALSNQVREIAARLLPDVKSVQGHVSAAVVGGQALVTATQQGKQRLQELETKRTMNNDDDIGDIPTMTLPKRKRLSLEEEYRQERQTVITSMDSLVAVKNILKNKG